jgi:23S rRNA pseudouridine1911/1915/1917 synthase
LQCCKSVAVAARLLLRILLLSLSRIRPSRSLGINTGNENFDRRSRSTSRELSERQARSASARSSDAEHGREFHVVARCELMEFLLAPPLGLSRKQAKELLKFQSVSVRGQSRVRHDTMLEAGDVVEIASRGKIAPTALARAGLPIVHLDDAVVVIDKPAGLLSMGSEREKERTAHRILNEHLKALTKSARQQIFIVHRLDRETSGLMVFARSESVQATLQRNWKDVTKRYLAIVEGTPAEASGTLRDHLVESKSFKVHRVEKGGELAITHYRVMKTFGKIALLELTLETGRKHQIRVQLAAIGHPIVGDRKYDAATDPAHRLALHSCELKLRHPVTHEQIEFHSELPDRLCSLLQRANG